MTARVIVGARIALLDAPYDVQVAVQRMTSYRNPEVDRRERLGLYTGSTDPLVTTWTAVPGGLSVPRGVERRLFSLLRESGTPYTAEDRTVRPSLDLKCSTGAVLRGYQDAALDELLATCTGVLEMPTGAGKTVVGLSAIPRLLTRTVVLVHRRELIDQWRERCRTLLGIEAGVVASGKNDLRPVTVASIQTLARRPLHALAPQFGLVLVDETHHAPARQWAGVIDQFPARFRYGLSATPWRKDGLDALINDYLGPVVARVTPSEVRQAGATVAPRFEVVSSDFWFPFETSSDWTRMISALVANDNRNDLIEREVRQRVATGLQALVLSDRVDHVRDLADRLCDLCPVVLHGEQPAADRTAGMAAVRAGARVTIATTGVLGEGVDAPGWSLLVMASPFAGGPRTLQAVGRVVRPAPGKREAVVLDILDAQVPALVGAYRSRQRLYREAA
jgi:superfamily II DNA or RNA helicase